MRRIQSCLLGALLCLLLSSWHVAVGAELQIPVYHATYTVGRGSLSIGTTRFMLKHDADGTYTYQSVTEPAGLVALFRSDVITETTTFSVEDGQLIPLHYSYSHTGDDDGNHSEDIQFQWDKGVARTVLGGKQHTLPIKTGTYDRLLAQLALSMDMEAARAVGQYRVLDHNGTNVYRMQRNGSTTLKTPAGEYRVIEMARKDTKKNRVTIFWLAPKLDYLPVQMEQTEPDKATISLVLTDFKFDTSNSK
jgi:hypothetical protein